MNPNPKQSPDERLKETARQFEYPPTPDVTGAVRKRLESGSRPYVERGRSIRLRSAWVVASLVVLTLAVLFAVPGVRAEIVRFFQVGVVRIFPVSPTETALPEAPNDPVQEVTIADIAGETTLAEAQSRIPFPIRLPAYPVELGAPDQVFLQDNGQMVILVWTDPVAAGQARLSLHQIGADSIFLRKFEPGVIRETQVNGQYAVWAEGPYPLRLTNGDIELLRTVEGNTLIWEEGGVTYRLESDLSLEETVKIAESLE